MIHPVPPFGFIPVMLLKQDPWVAREGASAESAPVAAAVSDPGQGREVLGKPQSAAASSAGCPLCEWDLVLSLAQTGGI